MQYKITKQYARGEEKLTAQFKDLNDAQFFVEQQIAYDEAHHIKLIYRLYDKYKLLQEFNIDKIGSYAKGQYAAGDYDLPTAIFNSYKLIQQSQNNVIAEFSEEGEATLFCQTKLAQNASLDFDLLCADGSSKKINQTQTSQTENQTRGQATNFRPTPFETAPKPSGSPSRWLKDEDKKE